MSFGQNKQPNQTEHNNRKKNKPHGKGAEPSALKHTAHFADFPAVPDAPDHFPYPEIGTGINPAKDKGKSTICPTRAEVMFTCTMGFRVCIPRIAAVF